MQIQDSLKNDAERLIKRSQLKRSDYKILGIDDDQVPDVKEEPISHYYEYIYDDNDFYQDMLKELVESRIADSGNIFLNDC